jgi:hypothetical protein
MLPVCGFAVGENEDTASNIAPGDVRKGGTVAGCSSSGLLAAARVYIGPVYRYHSNTHCTVCSLQRQQAADPVLDEMQ